MKRALNTGSTGRGTWHDGLGTITGGFTTVNADGNQEVQEISLGLWLKINSEAASMAALCVWYESYVIPSASRFEFLRGISKPTHKIHFVRSVPLVTSAFT